MKRIIRLLLINYTSLWLASWVVTGIDFLGGFRAVLMATVVLTLVNLLVKPIVKLLLLPLNILTLGTFRWLINVLSLYLVTVIVPQFTINSFVFEGFEYQGFMIPSFDISIFWAFVISSFFISLFSTFLFWIVKK